MVTTRSILFLFSFALLTAWLSGCETEEESASTGDETSTAATCNYGEENYEAGDSFPATDGCNSCSCDDNGEVSCTEMACMEGCYYGNETYDVGDVFPAGDGCNECNCEAAESVTCTELVCSSSSCEDKACGEICDPCEPGDEACATLAVEYVCDAEGQCTTDASSCEVYDPCEDKACGEICDPCEPGDEACATLAVEYVCDAEGQCTTDASSCEVYDPCEDKACGEICDPCEPGDEACATLAVEYVCDAEGQCTTDASSCEVYDPCINKSCGDACIPCDLNDPECQPEEIAMSCNDAGECVTAFDVTEMCDAGLCGDFTPPCWQDGDCPGDMVCYQNKDTCYPSDAYCDSETGEIISTADCGGGLCIEADNICADFIPPCVDDTECPNGMKCVFEGCNPSSASCDPITGEWVFTEDCGGGVCMADEDPCNLMDCEFGCEEGECLEDPCNFIDIQCPEGTFCYGGNCEESCTPGESVDAPDGCNSCTCPESGITSQANDCTEMACPDVPCATDAECGEGQYCDFPNDDCGVWGGEGTCVTPMACAILGGPGFCGCDGSYQLTDCDLHSSGTDVFKYGGCEGDEPVAKFECGTIQCNMEGEYCAITTNDIAGEGEPEYSNACNPLPDGCAQGDCSCVMETDFGECYDATGYTMTFYPGG